VNRSMKGFAPEQVRSRKTMVHGSSSRPAPQTEHPVLHWQRMIGNQAVLRMVEAPQLQRQTQAPQSISPPGSPITRWQQVTITPQDIHVADCGDTYWHVFFAPPAGATDGWIIQKVHWTDVDRSTRQIDGGYYWEAWPFPGVARDTFSGGGGRRRFGTRTHSGLVRYYPLALIPGATSTTIPGFHLGSTGQLETHHRPRFWTGAGGTRHALHVSWDCRHGHTGRPTVTSTPSANVVDWPSLIQGI
jgi:hypothetical protein